MEWNDETIARLRSLWDEGLSTAEIGRRLSVSKNAVVGKAHRMALPARPSPIRRDASAAPRAAAPRRMTGPTLPPLPANCLEASLVRPLAHPTVASSPERGLVVPGVAAPAPALEAVEPAPPIRVVPPAAGRHTSCCWPLGEPGTRTFRFCDADSLPGKPYCGDHAQVAYVKVRDRREEAA